MTVKCLAIVDSAKLLDGNCNGYFGADGGFAIGKTEGRVIIVVSLANKMGFVTVRDRITRKSVSDIQPATKRGACWVGPNVRVCAWKLNEKRWFAKNDLYEFDFQKQMDFSKATVADSIKQKCAEDWPKDFEMQIFCFKKQLSAFQELQYK